MKSLLVVCALVLSAGVFAGNGIEDPAPKKETNADQSTIARAMGALRSTCPDATGDLQASVSIVSACFVDGFVKNVTFYRVPNCPPNQVCIQVIQTVGTVTLDCGDNVIGVSCGSYVAF